MMSINLHAEMKRLGQIIKKLLLKETERLNR